MSLGEHQRRAALMVRTVAHLSPGQIGHRLRLRGLRAALGRWPGPFERHWRPLGVAQHWPEAFVPVDRAWAAEHPSPEDNAEGVFEFLGQRRHLGDPIDWRPADATQLWRYHLHYWEWAWPLAGHPDTDWARATFGRLWRSWQQGTTFGRWDEWSPFVVSIRAWVLCNLFHSLAAGTSVESELVADLGLHAGFVAANLELDVGGNHLIKNLKAAVALGRFLGQDRLTSLGVEHLRRQLGIQVLPDGGHFERSPSYHAQVLGDLIDIQGLLAASGSPGILGLDEAIAHMRTWLSTMLMPDGDVPPLNDSTLVGARRLTALGVGAAAHRRLAVLAESGYAVVRPDQRLHLVVDFGPPCPPALPAHAQADCLTFELAVDGQRFIVDPGTSTYEAGSQRAWERSTAAHNTVAMDGSDQTEVWATFRAARLAHATLELARDDGGVVTITGSHDGYHRLAGQPHHRRTWEMTPGRLIIRDQLTGRGRHHVSVRLQLAPGIEATMIGRDRIQAGGAHISIYTPSGEARLQILPAGTIPGGVSRHFGQPEAAVAIELTMNPTLPAAWTTTIDIKDGPG